MSRGFDAGKQCLKHVMKLAFLKYGVAMIYRGYLSNIRWTLVSIPVHPTEPEIGSFEGPLMAEFVSPITR